MRAAQFQNVGWPGTLQDLILKLARILAPVEELLDAQSGTSAKFTAERIVLEKHQNRFGHSLDICLRNHESGDSILNRIRHAAVLGDNRRNTNGHRLQAGACKPLRECGRAMDENVDAIHDCRNVIAPARENHVFIQIEGVHKILEFAGQGATLWSFAADDQENQLGSRRITAAAMWMNSGRPLPISTLVMAATTFLPSGIPNDSRMVSFGGSEAKRCRSRPS